MAQYDGSIRIGTEITTKQAEKELKNLESSISKTADKIASLRSKMDALKDVKLPTDEYKAIQNQIDATEKKINDLLARQEKFLATGGKESSSAYQKMQYDLEELQSSLPYLKSELQDLVESGKAFSLGSDTEEYAQMSAQMQQLNQQMQSDTQRQSELQSALASEEERLAQIKANATVSDQQIIDLLERRKQLIAEIRDMEAAGVGLGYQQYDSAVVELQQVESEIKKYKNGLSEVPERFSRMRAAAQKAFNAIYSGLSKIGNVGEKAFSALTSVAKKAFGAIGSGSKKSSGLLSTFASRLKGLALSLLIFNWISKGFNAMISGMKTGFENLMKYSDDYANSVQSLRNAMSTLGNSFAAAFAPIVQAAIPYLAQLINWVNRAVNAIAQLFAYLTGKATWTKATQIQNGYNDSLNGTASAAKKAYGALAKFDDLDVWQKPEENKAGGGASSGMAPEDMFEEVPVDKEIKKFGDWIKDLFSKIFEPFKAAWDREGKFVMDAWKYALDEVWKLIQDIGRDFLAVWNQEATIQIFADILHIIGDIGLIVGNLAKNFREAWNENETGLHILENIRDIFAVIVRHVRNAADATVEWSKKLDFGPLLDAFERFTDSLLPMVDAVSGIFEDFYTRVLLPLGKWTLEKGLPELLDVLTRFVEEVDWYHLRTYLQEFWDHLEPFAETVGEGLILFIERVLDLAKDFLNSEVIMDFLERLGNWMDTVTPEDVANGMELLVKSFIGLKVALAGLDLVIAGSKLVSFLANLKILFGDSSSAAKAGSEAMDGFGKSALGAHAGLIGFGAGIGILQEAKKIWENIFGPSEIKNVEDFAAALNHLRDEFINGKINAEEYEEGIDEIVQAAREAGIQVDEEAVQTIKNISLHKDEMVNAGTDVAKGFSEGIKSGISEDKEEMAGKFTELVDDVKERLGIHSPSTVFQEIGLNLIEGLLLGIQETWTLLTEWFGTTFEELSLFFEEKWTAIKEGATEIWDSLKGNLIEAWENIRESASEKFESIKKVFEDVWTGIKQTLDEKVKNIKEKIQELLTKFSTFKTEASTAFEGVKNSIVNALSPIIDKLKDFVQWVRDAISAVQDFFSSGYEKMGSAAGKYSKGGGYSASTYNVSAATFQASVADLPHLASGSVIRGGNPFLAILGDQRIGQTNVEAPLSTIEQAVENVMNRRGYNNMPAGGLNPTISLNVDGQEFARLTLNDILQEASRQGYDVSVLGVT